MITDNGQLALQAIAAMGAANIVNTLRPLRPETVHDNPEMAELFMADINRAAEAISKFKDRYRHMLRGLDELAERNREEDDREQRGR
jgi:hypothetical protein